MFNVSQEFFLFKAKRPFSLSEEFEIIRPAPELRNMGHLFERRKSVRIAQRVGLEDESTRLEYLTYYPVYDNNKTLVGVFTEGGPIKETNHQKKGN